MYVPFFDISVRVNPGLSSSVGVCVVGCEGMERWGRDGGGGEVKKRRERGGVGQLFHY